MSALTGWISHFLAGMRLQVASTSRDLRDLLPVATMPLSAMVAMAIFMHAQRGDLSRYAMVAALCMTIGQMAFFIASEFVSSDRDSGILLSLIASPANYAAVLFGRTAPLVVLSAISGWALATSIIVSMAGSPPTIYHPAIFVGTLAATAYAATCTALLTAAIVALGRHARTLQNSITGPVYLLSGVLVPTSYLPSWLAAISPLSFFTWAADLLRDCMMPGPVVDVGFRLFAIVVLGSAGAAVGGAALARMTARLRRSGQFSLS